MKLSRIILLTFIVTHAAPAQQHSDVQSKDTVAHRTVLLDPGISLGKPMLLLPPSLQGDAGLDIPPLIGGGIPGVPPPFLGGIIEQRADLISPFSLQMESADRLKTMRAVLGTVQIGGVAYLAYRHIKKYGLK